MIATENLSVSYHGRTVLSNATIKAEPGSILALVGPSGCGKSSFLAAINRLSEIIPGANVTGRVCFDGQDVQRVFPSPVDLRRHVGMIFQKPNPFAMSIRRNLELPLREHGIRDRGELRQLSESSLRDVGLWEEVSQRLDSPALELSGGQQQRLCIARAIALKPQVLLMDEPCSSLDPLSAERVEHLIESMKGRYTILIVTHNLAQARRLSDQIAVFWSTDGVGQIVEQGPTNEVFNQSTNPIVTSYLSGRRG